MNFSCADEPSSKVSSYLGAAARRALIPMISIIHESITRNWLELFLENQANLNGLHWECGSGEDTFLIASLMGSNNTLLGLDTDTVLLEKAKIIREQKGLNQITFSLSEDLSTQKESKAYDFIYTRFWASEEIQQQTLLKTMYKHLKPGGFLLIEVMQLAGFRAYPYNYAFARVAELIGILANLSEDTKEAWPIELEKTDFTRIKSSYVPPAFIPQANNGITSLALEGFSEIINRLQKTSREELKALLIEVDQFEKQADTLISRPGVFQIEAQKPV